MTLGWRKRWWLAAVLAASLAAGCSDPVRDDALDALGPEAPGIPAGPLHRAGQPCVGPCHDGSGPGAWVFSLAGTVYAYKGKDEPLVGAVVVLQDADKTRYRTATNCAGNFFVQSVDFTPTFPVWVAIDYGDGGAMSPDHVHLMSSRIFREGSCAACHAEPAGTQSAGRVYFADSPDVELPKTQECP